MIYKIYWNSKRKIWKRKIQVSKMKVRDRRKTLNSWGPKWWLIEKIFYKSYGPLKMRLNSSKVWILILLVKLNIWKVPLWKRVKNRHLAEDEKEVLLLQLKSKAQGLERRFSIHFWRSWIIWKVRISQNYKQFRKMAFKVVFPQKIQNRILNTIPIWTPWKILWIEISAMIGHL